MLNRTLPEGVRLALRAALGRRKTPAFVALVLIVLGLVSAGCALDTEKLQRTRTDLRELCQGPVTSALRAVCERAGYLPAPLTGSGGSQ